MGLGWEGEKVRLVPLDFDKHFENCFQWINDPEVNEWLGVGDLPMSRLAEKEWFEARQKSTHPELAMAIETLAGVHIGNTGLHRIDFKNGTAHTGSLIGDKENRGKGYGTDAAKVRAWYCFHVLGLRMLYSEYLAGNELSSRMQEKTGYKQYGVKPQAMWKRGEYRDMVLTYLSRADWETSL